MDFYHLSGATLAVGSVIDPGNWGRIIRAAGLRHGHALREMALQDARLTRFAHRPSRLDSAFVFLTADEARTFRSNTDGFHFHVLYRVSLCDAEALSHVTDWRLCMPQGTIRPNWADVYWMDLNAQAAAIPGMDWAAATNSVQLREMLTLSQLRIKVSAPARSSRIHTILVHDLLPILESP